MTPIKPEGEVAGGEERQAEATLRQREAFFRKVLQQSADITSVLAADGRRLFITSGITAVLGFTEEEALALKVAEATHPEDQARVVATFRRLLTVPGAVDRVRFRQRHKDGSYRLVDALVQNACHDPDVGGVVVTTRDVTEQVRLEEQYLQAQKLESVGRLAGGVAHDFNNLLTVILSCVELLQGEGETSPEGAGYVGEIAQAAERARGLTRQLLAFARKGVVSPGPVDLTAQVEASEKILRRLVGEDVRLEVDLERPLWPVYCDAGQVDQVLLNLVVNARDAMPGGGRLTLQTRNVPASGQAGDQVRLVVRDTGVGISPEARLHLFEPFFTTKPSGKGTGLGLATVHGIVQQHGGSLLVESAPGQGAAFEVLLPRCPPRLEPVEPAPEVPRAPAGECILLVEDEPVVRHLAENALVGAGYRVVPAADAESALRLLGDHELPLDLVVTDVVLPGGDGLKVAEYARQERPAIPVLFTSGYPADRLSSGGVLGAEVDLLPKPFTPKVLLRRVRAALDRRRSSSPATAARTPAPPGSPGPRPR